MKKYPAKLIFDKSNFCYTVEFPDLPGCYASGETKEVAITNAKKALYFYTEEISFNEIDLPEPSSIKEENALYLSTQ